LTTDQVSASASSPAVEISGLSKSYVTGFLRKRTHKALVGVSLAVPSGEILGYLGPNGSGKTTTLKILMGLIFPDAGSVSLLGLPQRERPWRHRVGYLPENPYLYDYLTPAEYLDYAGRLFGMSGTSRRERSRDLLQLVGLASSMDVPMRRFSKGMLQRAGLAQALINDPELVFLDEPMSGLDPIGRRLVREILVGLREKGKTVFFSTHILSDAETICDRIALLRAGHLLKVGRLDEILNLSVSHVEVLVTGVGAAALDGIAGVRARRELGERFRLEVADGAVGPVAVAVEAAGGRILEIHPIRQSLEEYFIKEMGSPASASALLEAAE
jgi:ABC-2 type transport system ATP-binding protein